MRIRERFNPRAPCGARRHGCRYGQPDRTISTHAPLAGATDCAVFAACTYLISTHAPLAGRDADHVAVHLDLRISTHAPLAGRDAAVDDFTLPSIEFQPTRPLRGATAAAGWAGGGVMISTHAPLAGRDPSQVREAGKCLNFNPRALRARHLMEVYLHQSKNFNPRALRARRTHRPGQQSSNSDFNPRAFCGRDAPPLFRHNNIETISTHAPCGARPVIRCEPQ